MMPTRMNDLPSTVQILPTPMTEVRRAQPPTLLPDRQRIPSRVWHRVWHRPVDHRVSIDLGEYVRYTTRFHWTVNIRTVTKSLLSMIMGVLTSLTIGLVTPSAWWVQLIVLGAVVVHQAYLLFQVCRWRIGGAIVTNRRLILVSGLFLRRESSVFLNRITNAEHRHSLIQDWFGYGWVRIESGGQHDEPAKREWVGPLPRSGVVYSMLTPT